MKTNNITDIIEQSARLEWQESYDNAGLIVGDSDAEIDSALLCVDITEEVIDEAIALGAGLIIAHHPIIFHPIKRITGQTYIERTIAKALQHGIALYACHTNLDSAPEIGINHHLARLLGIRETALLEESEVQQRVGIGIIGELDAPIPIAEMLERIKRQLNLKVIRHSIARKADVQRIAVCGGAGSSLLWSAKKAGADMYISADFKYNDFLNADREMIIADVGHFESEYCAIQILFDVIRKKLPTFALHRSKCSRNPINYLV